MYLMQMRWLILDECIDIEYQIRENLSKIHQSSREARWNVGEVKGLPLPSHAVWTLFYGPWKWKCMFPNKSKAVSMQSDINLVHNAMPTCDQQL